MAARLKIIILEKDVSEVKIFRYVFWADVPTARQPFYAKPAGTVSAWAQATATDNQQLVSGAVAEQVGTINGQGSWNMASYQAELQLRWQDYQNMITNSNPWNRYGSTWDGTTWTTGGVA